MQKTVEIQHLKCSGCKFTVKKKLGSLKGVENISVNIAKSSVSFSYKNDAQFYDIENTLAKLSHPLIDAKNGLGRKAKSFVSCPMGRIRN